jgi:hypothetical protein
MRAYWVKGACGSRRLDSDAATALVGWLEPPRLHRFPSGLREVPDLGVEVTELSGANADGEHTWQCSGGRTSEGACVSPAGNSGSFVVADPQHILHSRLQKADPIVGLARGPQRYTRPPLDTEIVSVIYEFDSFEQEGARYSLSPGGDDSRRYQLHFRLV